MRRKGATGKGVSKPRAKVLAHHQVERLFLVLAIRRGLLVCGRLPISGDAQNANHSAFRIRDRQPFGALGRSLERSCRIVAEFLGADGLGASMMLSPVRSTLVHRTRRIPQSGGMEKGHFSGRSLAAVQSDRPGPVVTFGGLSRPDFTSTGDWRSQLSRPPGAGEQRNRSQFDSNDLGHHPRNSRLQLIVHRRRIPAIRNRGLPRSLRAPHAVDNSLPASFGNTRAVSEPCGQARSATQRSATALRGAADAAQDDP